MLPFLKLVGKLFSKSSDKEKDGRLSEAIRQITGSKPDNLNLYKLALMHTSAAKGVSPDGFRESNERLEYLGDAILGAVVAEYLFKRFPFKGEGFLTEIRSRIVNRESLNGLGKKLGLNNLIIYDGHRRTMYTHKSMNGDALEALVGAVYLDKGFKNSRKFIVKRLIVPHFDLEKIIETNLNFKSIMIEWAQRENKKLRFEIVEERGDTHNKEFIARIFLDDQPFATGGGHSKKKAEQSAAEKACEMLEIK